ncbi:hypothetical protein DICVIV_07660 [Dictyocaulus viviparus]|uniref:Uncharacterized protein n=1 Tax=Dictyocaulus viviparus TaxID=29172 RepID=A0A0D8XNR8_DICVI|nr:hypothetical protein DICVIV_07660 [Dictyocaulus viviparus]
MFSFIKIIVDDDEKILVSDVFMRKMRDLATDEVVLSCSPLKVGRVLRSLTGGVIDGPRSKYGLSTFYTTAGLKASWCGTIWEVPLRASTFQFHLCLIRPRFLGDIVKLKSRLSGQDLRDIFEELLRVKTKRHKLLIPVFSLKCEENLACMWMKKGKSYMSESEVLPPIDAIWNITKLSISVDGVGTHDFKLKPHPRLPPSYRSYMNFDSIHHSHTTYAASIDSSFIFIITQRGKIPLLAGCYAGHPSPCNLTFTFPAPERIRNKPPVKLTQKTRKKLSKKQKKALQLNRWRANST